MPGVHEQELKKKLEEVWQSGGAGREALREELWKEFRKWYFYIFELYGNSHFDDWIKNKYGFIDPYWIAKTRNEYYVIHSTSDDTIIIVKDKKRVKSINIGVSEAKRTVDVYPESDKILYNKAGVVTEYDIPSDRETPLFTVDETQGMCLYYPPDREKILIMAPGSNTIKLYNRDGALEKTWSTPRSSRFGSAVVVRGWYIIYQYDFGYEMLKYEDASWLSQIDKLDGPGWLYMKGPYITYGGENTYAFVTEVSGVPHGTFPFRSNNIFITDDFTFIGTYWFSVFELTERDLLYTPKAPMISAWRPTIEAGGKFNRNIVLGNRVKARISFRSSDSLNFRVYKFISYLHGDFFGTPFQVSPWVTPIYEKTGVTSDTVEIDGCFLVQVELENTGTTSVDAYLEVHTVGF